MQQLDIDADIISKATHTEFPDIRIWAAKLSPIPADTPQTDRLDFGEGSCLMKYHELVQFMYRNPDFDEENIWTVSGMMQDRKELIHGIQYHDAYGYIACERTPNTPFYGSIYIPRNY